MARSTLFHAKLYGIVDLGYADRSALIRITAEMIEGGIDVIQFRAKGHEASEIEKWGATLLPICREGGVPFFINDHAAVAAAIGADGIHVGQDDASMDEVRAIVGDSMLSTPGFRISRFSVSGESRSKIFPNSSQLAQNVPLSSQASCKHPTLLLMSAQRKQSSPETLNT